MVPAGRPRVGPPPGDRRQAIDARAPRPAPRREPRGRRGAVVDPQTSSKRHLVGTAVRRPQYQRVASRHVRHSDALVGGEIRRNDGSAAEREVFRSRDEQAPAPTERAEFHRAVGERSQAERDIDALPHEVDAFVGETEIDPDVGMAILKGENHPADVPNAESRRAGDPNRAGRSAARAPRLIAGALHQTQDPNGLGVITTHPRRSS